MAPKELAQQILDPNEDANVALPVAESDTGTLYFDTFAAKTLETPKAADLDRIAALNQPERLRGKSIMRRTKQIAGSLALTLAVQNGIAEAPLWINAEGWLDVFKDEVSMKPTGGVCGLAELSGIPDPEGVRNHRSSAFGRGVSPDKPSAPLRLDETLRQGRDILRYPQTSFVSSHSGIEFIFYSDIASADWEIDHQAFDDTFHASLLIEGQHADTDIAEINQCLSTKIIDEKAYAGTKYHVSIPNSLQACLAKGRVLSLSDEAGGEIPEMCRQTGGTPPTIEVNALWWKPLSANIMIITPGGRATPETINHTMTERLIHEAEHAFLTLTETPLRIEPDERWSEYNERHTMTQLSSDDRELTPYISYSEVQLAEWSDELERQQLETK